MYCRTIGEIVSKPGEPSIRDPPRRSKYNANKVGAVRNVIPDGVPFQNFVHHETVHDDKRHRCEDDTHEIVPWKHARDCKGDPKRYDGNRKDDDIDIGLAERLGIPAPQPPRPTSEGC